MWHAPAACGAIFKDCVGVAEREKNANAREPGYLDYLITPPIDTTFSQYTTTSHIRTSTTNKILKH
jgi:hypothetical protein